MMDLLRWLNGAISGSSAAHVPGFSQHDLIWSAVTIVLSVCVAAGYCAVAINWFFQSKLARHAEKIEGHVLTPWVEYWRLSLKLEDATTAGGQP